MLFHSLQLSLKPGNWRLFLARKMDVKFESFTTRVLERDRYTCRYCGFQARQFQEVVNLDQNYRNNKLDNLVTSCCFCTQSLFVESVGKSDYGGGSLVYLPEMTQSELNGLCHVLFCAITNATSYRSDAQAIYRNFKLRAKIVEEQLGEGMSNPSALAQMLMDANIDDRQDKINRILSNLRLLPSRSKFSDQIETWAQAALEELSTS